MRPEGTVPDPRRVLTMLVATAPLFTTAQAAPRVVAIGDLHGDYDQAVATLKLARLVDDQAGWIGADAILVQTGDYTDRGPDSKEIMELLARLEVEAKTAGGHVHVLLGNHEVMNMQGDWRYVHPGDIEDFGTTEHRAEAFSPTGPYGQWLSKHPIVTVVADTVFTHGGVTPRWAQTGLEHINTAAAGGLFAAPEGVLGPDGPLWYRGFVVEDEASICGELEKSLAALGAKRMVVGHTTRSDGRIQARCQGRLHVIDVGISSAYGGNLAAWEMTNGDARALYPEGPTDLEDPPQ